MDDDRHYGLEFALLHHEFGTVNMESRSARTDATLHNAGCPAADADYQSNKFAAFWLNNKLKHFSLRFQLSLHLRDIPLFESAITNSNSHNFIH